MYETPKLERFGTFRELTMIGNMGDSDGFPVMGDAGSNTATCQRGGEVTICTPTNPAVGRS